MASSARSHSFLRLFVWGTARDSTIKLLTEAVGFASTFIILSKLSVYQYGLYQLVLAALGVAITFTSGLFDDVIANDLARAIAAGDFSRSKRLANEIMAVKLALGLAAFAAFFFGAGIIAHFYDPGIAYLIRLGSILLLIRMIRSAQGMIFSAGLSFVTFGASALEELVRLAAIAVLVYRGSFGVAGVLASSIVAAVAVEVYLAFFFVRHYRALFSGVAAASRSVLAGLIRAYGVWVLIRFGFSKIFKQMDVFLVRIFLNTEAVGFYTLAMNAMGLIQNFLPVSMLGTLLPWELGTPERVSYIYRKVLTYGFWIGAAAAALSIAVIPEAVKFFLPKYAPVLPLLTAMLLTLPLYVVYRSQKIFLLVLREQKMLTVRIITEAVLTGAVLVIFLPVIGLMAVVVEYFVTYGYRVFLYLIYIKRKYPELSVSFRDFVAFDRRDWELGKRAAGEALNMKGWLGPIRVSVRPGREKP